MIIKNIYNKKLIYICIVDGQIEFRCVYENNKHTCDVVFVVDGHTYGITTNMIINNEIK